MNKREILNKKVEILKTFLNSEDRQFEIFEKNQKENIEIINQNFVDSKQDKNGKTANINKK